MPLDINFMVGGEAGQGVQTIGHTLAKALGKVGYHVFADQDYESRIRGGHNFFRVRAKDSEVAAISERVNMLVALNHETIDLHRSEVADDGVIVFDKDKLKDVQGDARLFGVPLQALAEEMAKNKLMENMVALGVVLGVADYDRQMLTRIVRQQFEPLGSEVVEANVAATMAGFEYAKKNFKAHFPYRLTPIAEGKWMVLNGNDAISLGAIAAGCKFVAGYPMTPSTPILEYMASKAADLGLVMVQPEDEISAVNMIIGAAYAGVRAMTATSGGGFSLMVEALGLSGMTETPIVIVEGQRAGPAIGLPTRTEQGDLEFVIHASHGEFPRAVMTPGTIEQAFWLTVKAFNLAEKYQVPVIILNDQYLASSYATVDKFDLSKVTIDRGEILAAEQSKLGEYRRYKITQSGVSPRAIPMQGTGLVVEDADAHNEEGHIIEDAATRTAMMEKRLRKVTELREEIGRPFVYGPEDADTTLICWGSTYGPVKEAVGTGNSRGMKLNMVHLSEIWPFPRHEMGNVLQVVNRGIAVENNATGQLAHLIRAETGYQVRDQILKFDGRPFSPAYILNWVKQEVLV